jgi:hypothetical protein
MQKRRAPLGPNCISYIASYNVIRSLMSGVGIEVPKSQR